MRNTITIQGHRKGTVTITGLTAGDLRLLGRALREGRHQAGDKGGPVSDAILRFDHAMRATIALDRVRRERIEIAGGTSDPDELYEELLNLEHANRNGK